MIDLHIHSIYSDGTYSPKQLAEYAEKKDLKAVSLTDHDTIDGLKEAREEFENKGIEFIDGIEFSTEYKGHEVHILSYFIDIKDKILIQKLKRLQDERVSRTEEILEKLKKLKIDISMEEIKKVTTSNLISRSHIAYAMLQKGYVYSIKEAFINYIGAGGAAYVPKKDAETTEIVRMIRENKALSFLAHPKFINIGEKKLLNLIEVLKENGLDGLEVYYSTFSEKDKAYYSRIAKENNLLLSGGSDFHGGLREKVELGIGGARYQMLRKMKERLKEKYGK